jgi:hypothetical protein
MEPDAVSENSIAASNRFICLSFYLSMLWVGWPAFAPLLGRPC